MSFTLDVDTGVGLSRAAMHLGSLIFPNALDDPDTPSRMCLVAGMVTPDVLADPDMRAFVENAQARFRDCLIELIERDKQNGALPATMDAQLIAAIVATYGQGMTRMGLVAYDRARMERETETFLVARSMS